MHGPAAAAAAQCVFYKQENPPKKKVFISPFYLLKGQGNRYESGQKGDFIMKICSPFWLENKKCSILFMIINFCKELQGIMKRSKYYFWSTKVWLKSIYFTNLQSQHLLGSVPFTFGNILRCKIWQTIWEIYGVWKWFKCRNRRLWKEYLNSD